jgi:hypothetical protein
MDEVYYVDFSKTGVEIIGGIITGMKVANVIDHKGHLRKNKSSLTEYLINQSFGRDDIEGGYSYDLGDQTADTILEFRVFETYEQAFDYLNNMIQEKKR